MISTKVCTGWYETSQYTLYQISSQPMVMETCFHFLNLLVSHKLYIYGDDVTIRVAWKSVVLLTSPARLFGIIVNIRYLLPEMRNTPHDHCNVTCCVSIKHYEYRIAPNKCSCSNRRTPWYSFNSWASLLAISCDNIHWNVYWLVWNQPVHTSADIITTNGDRN